MILCRYFAPVQTKEHNVVGNLPYFFRSYWSEFCFRENVHPSPGGEIVDDDDVVVLC
jgi:hypothetical protein